MHIRRSIHVLVGSHLHFDRLMVHVTIMLQKVADALFYLEVSVCIWSNKQDNNVQLTRRHTRTLDNVHSRAPNWVTCTNPQIIYNIGIKKFYYHPKKNWKFCSITKSSCGKWVCRASWSLLSIKHLFMYLYNYIFVIVHSWYYHMVATKVNLVIYYWIYCYVLQNFYKK